MLPIDRIVAAQRMLDAGDLSHRAIAKLAGVSRQTVDNLAAGRRGLEERELGDETEASRPSSRCPTCGVRVYEPCVYCRTIAYLAELRGHQNPHNPTASRRLERRAA